MKVFVIDKRAVITVCIAVFLAVVLIPFCNGDVVTVSQQGKELPIYCVDKADKEISITFDSAWGNEDLEKIMETLDLYNCKATFFVVGDFLDKYPEDVKKLSEKGHEIANHSNNHAHYNSLSRDQMIEDMNACDEKIKKLTGKDNVIFRAPYGEYNTQLVRTCNDTKRYCIQWDVDSLDWKGLTPEQMEKRVFEKVKPGSILLFHNGAPHTAEALPQILNRLKNEGYTFKTVSDLIFKDGYYIDNTGKQCKSAN